MRARTSRSRPSPPKSCNSISLWPTNGPEAKDVRAQLRQGIAKTIDEVWGSNESDANFVANNFAGALRNLRTREAALAALHPSTEKQTQALAAAKATVDSIGQSRLQIFALASPISIPLILTVTAWATFLFFGYGLIAGGNATSFVAVAVGALAVASAAYLIFDLSGPYSGLFRASSAPLEQVLAVIGKE
jgi:hypothetical protein